MLNLRNHRTHHAHNLLKTCNPGCRCVRQFPVFDSVEADFRTTCFEGADHRADELVVKKVGHGFPGVRINRAGRCLEVWNEALRAEAQWLRSYEAAVDESKRVEREQEEVERLEREAEELRRAAAEEAEKERKKARFVGSFMGLKWL